MTAIYGTSINKNSIKVHTHEQFREQSNILYERIRDEQKKNDGKLKIHLCDYHFLNDRIGYGFLKVVAQSLLKSEVAPKENFHYVEMEKEDDDTLRQFILVLCSPEQFEKQVKPLLEDIYENLLVNIEEMD